MADGKKNTDILPPEKTDDSGASNSAPATITKHASSGTFAAKDDNNPTETVSTNAETQDNAATAPSQNVSKSGVSIKPISENVAPEESTTEQTTEPAEQDAKPAEPEVSDYVSKPAEDNEKPAEEPKEENNEPPVSAADKAYEASDSLPDENDKKTAEATDEMQSPKIYDTKEYFVPIKKTAHSHGHLGVVIAGIVTAIIVAAGVALAAIYLY